MDHSCCRLDCLSFVYPRGPSWPKLHRASQVLLEQLCDKLSKSYWMHSVVRRRTSEMQNNRLLGYSTSEPMWFF
jgi:hypothetical protein